MLPVIGRSVVLPRQRGSERTHVRCYRAVASDVSRITLPPISFNLSNPSQLTPFDSEPIQRLHRGGCEFGVR
jgi:hypothetical protein